MLTLQWPLSCGTRPDLKRAAQWVFFLSNRERTLRALRPAEHHARLDEVAAFHSTDMARRAYFDHLDPEGNGPQERMQRVIPELIGGFGENLSMITAEPEENLARDVVDGWMHSPGHRNNLLTPTHTYMGIGLCQVSHLVYVTQFFANLEVELLGRRLPIYLCTAQSTTLRFRNYRIPRSDVAAMVRIPDAEAWLSTGNGMYMKGAIMLRPQWESTTDFRLELQARYGRGIYRIQIGQASSGLYIQQGFEVKVA